MRLRLFALLLVPALIVIVLAASIISQHNTQHQDAISAAETASLARRMAVLDEAIGVEALAGARAIGQPASAAEFMTIYVRTNAAIEDLRADAAERNDQELLNVLVPVGEALSLRGEVELGLVSPLQLLDRYTQLRSQLLVHLAQRISLDAGSDTDPIRGLIAIIEARSEHLDERLEIELAITYQTWAPGLFGEVARSIGIQQDRLAEAASLTQDTNDVSPPDLLQQYREEILLAPTIPTFSLESYQEVSDSWIEELNVRIADEAGQIERESASAEAAARSQRNETTAMVTVGLLVALLVVGFVSYGIVHRLGIITHRARLFAEGRIPGSDQEPVGGNDEISQLAVTFDDMVNQVHQRDRRLAIQARTDELTEIDNRQHIIDFWVAAAAAGDGRSIACLVDLDNFKPINDEFGHHAGDQVLRSVAKRLCAFFENLDLAEGRTVADGRAGRIGGDEFLVVLTNFDGDDEELAVTAQRLGTSVSEPISVDGSTFELVASIGAVRSRLEADHLELLRDADEAMYAAKGLDGENVVVSTPAAREKFLAVRQDRRAVVEALRAGQIGPWFQPIRTVAGKLAGFEALARWTTDEGAVRFPDTFLDVLESERLLPELDAVMFEAVCRQIVSWNGLGLEVDRVSVNFSAESIEQPDFGACLERILDETGCPPTQLAVEVTESILMSDIETNAHLLQQLRGRGIRVDIDDFGTGYSSLRYLRDLPVDSVKIDRVFIASIQDFPASQAIVRSVVALANDLNISVVAEGVETLEELGWLRANDIDRLQGYLLGRGGPVDGATALLEKESARELQVA